MKKVFIKSLNIILAISLLVTGAFSSFYACADNVPESSGVNISQNNIEASDYYEYLNSSDASCYTGDDVAADPGVFEGNFIALNENNKQISLNVNVPEHAGYSIMIKYKSVSGNGLNIKFGFKIDGAYPFKACEGFQLSRMWMDSSEPRTDSVGNEYSSEQIEYTSPWVERIKDDTGAVSSDYIFFLDKGEHIVSIEILSQSIELYGVWLVAPDEPKSYSDISSKYDSSKDYKGDIINIEGEKAVLKSTRSIVAKSDNSSPTLSPANPLASKLNYIGGVTWKTAGEKVVWEFDAPESGYYKMGFSFKQSDVLNGFVYRKLYIDGKLPFSEAKCIGFKYSSKWQFEALGGEKPYYIWLEKGRHSIALEVTLGDIGEVYNDLRILLSEIGDMYLKIIMITGESPDLNRDYDLFKQIEGFNDNLKNFEDRLLKISQELQSISGEKTNNNIATVQNMKRVITSMLENPYTAQVYLSDYYSQYSALGSVVTSMVEMPLCIDRIQLCSPCKEFETGSVSFGARVLFSVKRFLVSFLDEYSRISFSEKTDKESIKIWINWGRDQAMVLNSLIQESFTAKTGINVNLELTNASLVKGMLSNTQPDLALQLSRTDPVNLAMRGALYDLSSFDDYDEVIKRFGATATEPYKYSDGVYALPDTQSFYLMFYRSDIFEKLGLSVPKTWDEFLHVASNIARNNMTVYLPYVQIGSATTVNTGIGGLNLFATILQQQGGSIYNEELNASTLKSSKTLSAFRFWTKMYTDYKIPTAQSFYNRFKVGTCPLGIESYSMYTMFSQAASEIEGCWGIATVPGTKNQNGAINKTVSGAGTGCVILNKSDRKDAAWEFLKWWTSADTQLSFNNNVESILGAVSRTSTATLEAFETMSWNEDDLEILKEQRSYIAEVPEIPGSYYLSRAVDQAFWQVIDGVYNPKDALYRWGEIADAEIDRKIEEYS